MRSERRRHDDEHRPLGGRGQRANATRKGVNWGGAVLVRTPTCSGCGQLLPHGSFGCDSEKAASDATMFESSGNATKA